MYQICGYLKGFANVYCSPPMPLVEATLMLERLSTTPCGFPGNLGVPTMTYWLEGPSDDPDGEPVEPKVLEDA